MKLQHNSSGESSEDLIALIIAVHREGEREREGKGKHEEQEERERRQAEQGNVGNTGVM